MGWRLSVYVRLYVSINVCDCVGRTGRDDPTGFGVRARADAQHKDKEAAHGFITAARAGLQRRRRGR